jgi:hypothetical protein
MLDEFTCLISVPVNSRARVWGELGRCLKKPSFNLDNPPLLITSCL